MERARHRGRPTFCSPSFALPLVALVLGACSDNTKSLPTPDSSTPTPDVATVADAAVTIDSQVTVDQSTDPDAPSALCRNYASEFTDDDSRTTTCDFDDQALRLTCDREGSKTYYDYPSVAAFVEEAQAVGRVTYTKRSTSTSSTVFIYSYDDQDRLTGFDHETQADFYQHYDAWDAKGRPTAGTGSYDADDCTGYGVGFTYDDGARTAYQQYSGTEVCSSGTYTFYHARSYYDANANLIKREFVNMSDELARTENFTIVATTQICL